MLRLLASPPTCLVCRPRLFCGRCAAYQRGWILRAFVCFTGEVYPADLFWRGGGAFLQERATLVAPAVLDRPLPYGIQKKHFFWLFETKAIRASFGKRLFRVEETPV